MRTTDWSLLHRGISFIVRNIGKPEYNVDKMQTV